MISSVAATVRRYARGGVSVEERNIRNLVIQTAFAGAVGGGIGTFLTVFAARLGASTLTVSLLTALPALVTIAAALPAGAIVARQRRLVRDSALAFLAVRLCYLAIVAAAFLPAPWATRGIVAVWAMSAIPAALANTAWYGVFAEAVPARRRAAVNGGRWAILGLVTAGCVAVFGVVLDRFSFPSGYQVVFLVSFVAGVLNVWYYAKLSIPDQEPKPRPAATEHPLALARSLVKSGPFVRFCLGSTILRIGLFLAVGLYSVFWVRDLGASDAVIGLRTTVGNAALVIGYPLWGWAASKFGHERALVASAAGLGLYPIATGFAPSAVWLLPVALIWGLFAGGIDVTLFEGLLHSSPPEQRAHYVAVNTALANTVALGAPLLGAALAGVATIRPVLVAAGVLHIVAAVVVAALARRAVHTAPAL